MEHPQGNGEDADGFAAKFDELGEGNAFVRLRAWSNADDGFDFWHAPEMTVVDCWSFDNGFSRTEWADRLDGAWQGDGLGFELGQAAGPLHLTRVVAWGNKAFGIDDNGNGSVEGLQIVHATLVNNAKDGNPIQISLDDGRPHHVDLDMPTLFAEGSGPRGKDGALPELGLRLAEDSAAIDAGTDVGFPWLGDAPDLGVFERE